MLQNALLEHSAIFLTCINQYLVLKPNFGLLFEWPLNTGFTVNNFRTSRKNYISYSFTAFYLCNYAVNSSKRTSTDMVEIDC